MVGMMMSYPALAPGNAAVFPGELQSSSVISSEGAWPTQSNQAAR